MGALKVEKQESRSRKKAGAKVQSGAPHRRFAELGIVVAFVLLAALFYAPTLFGVRAFPDGDFVYHFLPFSVHHHAQLAVGHLALWNPYTYGGHPFLADVQAAVFYPIGNLIHLFSLTISDVATLFYLLEVEVVVHTALAGYFAYLWTRDLAGGSRWGGLIGGITFALSGYVTGYAPLQLAVLRVAVWLPLLLWALGRAWQEPEGVRWWLVSIGALAAAFFAGHSQTFLFIVYATAGWVLTLMVVEPGQRNVALWRSAVVALAAAGVTAIQWLPSFEFVIYSVRAEVDYAFVSGGLALADFWQLVLPGVLTQFSPIYVGVIGVILAFVALFAVFARQRPQVERSQPALPKKAGATYSLVLTVVALLASLGGNGPLYPLLYWIAPGFSMFRGQERAAFLVALGLSGLAAYGMAVLPRMNPATRRRAGLVAGAVVVATVYAFGLLWQLQGRTALDHVGYLLVAGPTLVLGLAGALLVSLPGWSLQRGAWLVTLAVVNLVWANAATNQLPGTPADRVRVAPEVSAIVQAVAERDEIASGLAGRVYNEYRVYDDYGMLARVEDVWGSSPLRVARYSALFEEFPLDRMWRLLGVEHVLTWRRELFGPSTLLAEFPQIADTTYLHRLPAPNPRAWFVSEVVSADDAQALQLIGDHTFDLDQRAVVPEDYAHFAFERVDEAETGTVTLARINGETIEVVTEVSSDAFLVVSEVWLPGWEIANALCNGAACPESDAEGRAYLEPIRANYTLLGMLVPTGTNTFTLRYNPISFRIGMWISVGTSFILALSALVYTYRRRVTER